MSQIRHLENRYDVIFLPWIKFRRLVKSDMSTAVIYSKWKPKVEFQYGGRLGELSGMSSQSHVPHCRVLPPGEFNVMIPEPYATLQGERIPSAIKSFFAVFYCFFVFLMQFGGAFFGTQCSVYRRKYNLNIVSCLISCCSCCLDVVLYCKQKLWVWRIQNKLVIYLAKADETVPATA